MSIVLFCNILFLLKKVLTQGYCEEGYTCFEQPSEGVVWVMKNDGNVHGPSCSSVCQAALCGTGQFHVCDPYRSTPQDPVSFAPIAEGLGFTCKTGNCWSGEAPGVGMMMVSIETTGTEKNCYYPTETEFNCHNDVGNANCFGERYSLICPCVAKDLDEACLWESPPNNVEVAKWPHDEEGTTCIDRVNYYRKKACEEGWPECPPCGLPPMVECVACHECANSQAEYDSTTSAHASFKRCGDMVQGEGGGATCANVIDGFVSERQVFDDSDGKVVCRGHCGPIVSHGCQTFFWGRAETSNFHTLNWRTCNVEECSNYCNDPSDNSCFLHEDSPCYTHQYRSLTSGNCEACSSQCAQCSTGPSDSECTECYENAELLEAEGGGGGNSCQCVSNAYAKVSKDVSTCTLCPSGCLTCENELTCTSCEIGYYMNTGNSQCVKCIDGCAACSTTTTCVECFEGKYLTADKTACLSCIDNCAVCTDASTCTRCTVDYVLKAASECVEKSDEGEKNIAGDSKLGSGAIAGISIGIIAAVLVIGCLIVGGVAALIIVIVRKNRQPDAFELTKT